MKAQTSLYAGIMIPTQTKPVLVKKRICEEHGQVSHVIQYCPKCGNKIVEKEFQTKVSLDCYGLLGQENLYTKFIGNKTVLVSNMGFANYIIPEGEPVEISQELINTKKRIFEIHHQKDIDELKAKLNIDIEISIFVLIE